MAPEDFFSLWATGDITLSRGFGVDKLQAFDARLPIPFLDVTMEFRRTCAVCDVSFLTSITNLEVKGLVNCQLTLPTSVVTLNMDDDTSHVTVSGTENLTYLEVPNGSIKTALCPRLRELVWYGETLSQKRLPCQVGGVTTLVSMTIDVDEVDPAFQFPPQLTSLCLLVQNDSVNLSQLTPLTRLQSLEIDVDGDPLDLSGLTTLTWIDSNETLILALPTSLVECDVTLRSDFDFSSFTNLTSLEVLLDGQINVTFPTGVKELRTFNRDCSQ